MFYETAIELAFINIYCVIKVILRDCKEIKSNSSIKWYGI